MTTIYDFPSPLGLLRYTLDDHHRLTTMSFVDGLLTFPTESPLSEHLTQYFTQHQPIVWPVHFTHGTPFQQLVWNALLTIPYGTTTSYQQLAQAIGRPKAIRAVGQACKNNPIGVVVPCHRVIGADGSLTGYSGKGFIHLKQALLMHEKTSK